VRLARGSTRSAAVLDVPAALTSPPHTSGRQASSERQSQLEKRHMANWTLAGCCKTNQTIFLCFAGGYSLIILLHRSLPSLRRRFLLSCQQQAVEGAPGRSHRSHQVPLEEHSLTLTWFRMTECSSMPHCSCLTNCEVMGVAARVGLECAHWRCLMASVPAVA